MNFPSGAHADFEGLLEVNQKNLHEMHGGKGTARCATELISGSLMLTDPKGRYLSAAGGLSLTEEPSEDDLSRWELIERECGYSIKSVAGNQALQYYGGRITIYSLGSSDLYLFNFYEVVG